MFKDRGMLHAVMQQKLLVAQPLKRAQWEHRICFKIIAHVCT